MEAPEDILSGLATEILDMIFSFCDADDLKDLRLVNKKWCDVANNILSKRTYLKLEATDKKKERTIEKDLNSIISVNDYKNVKLVGRFPENFESHFSPIVVSLYLKNITLRTDNELRRIMYEAFPQLKELGLDHVWTSEATTQSTMPVNDPRCPLPTARLEHESKLEKLVLNRQGSKAVGNAQDVFQSVDIAEVIQTFAGTLKVLYVNSWTGRNGVDIEFDFASALQSANIFAYDIDIYMIANEDPINSLKSYLLSHGKNLKRLGVYLKGNAAFDNFFGTPLLSLCPLEYLKLRVEGGLSPWAGEELQKLKHVDLGCGPHNSLRFLSIMPNLEKIEYPVFSSQYEPANYVAEKVHTLTLSDVGYIEVLARIFPNIRTLILRRKRFHGTRYDYLANIASAWPNIEQLEVREEWSQRDYTKHRRRARENVEPYQLHWLPLLSNLRSYVHHDLPPFRVCYDSGCAMRVFLNVPNLRILQIGRCSMSQQVVDTLRDNLVVFKFKERC